MLANGTKASPFDFDRLAGLWVAIDFLVLNGTSNTSIHGEWVFDFFDVRAMLLDTNGAWHGKGGVII